MSASMSLVQFTSVIAIRGVNPYIAVSPARAAKIKPGWRRSLPVLVRIDGVPETRWRINLMPDGRGGFYLYLNGGVRKETSAKVGDRVRVEIRFDSTYRHGPQHPMPPWFRTALSANPAAKKNWDALVPSRKKEILRYFSWLKSAAARRRNAGRALHVLSGKEARFMGRTWKDGR
jgi:hypothetical protein